MTGRLVIVGAGPGAPDLITLRGARAIAAADIVIWASSLVHPDLVAGHRPDALMVDSASASLEDLVPHFERAAREGLTIARVHTGDPALYGATNEQRDVALAMGLVVETIPGVTAYAAAAASINAELTAPEVAQSLIVTRLEGGRTPMPEREAVARFAAHGTTMALYLSAGRGQALQTELLAGGYDPQTPAVVGHKVTWPEQLVVRTTVGQIAATLEEHGLDRHTVVLVGPALAEAPVERRSYLYHPGFAHGYRPSDPQAAEQLRRDGAVTESGAQ